MMLGVCSNIKPSGPLDGTLGGRFLTAFCACLFTGIAKMVLVTWVANLPTPEDIQNLPELPISGSLTTLQKAMWIMILILPPLLLAIISIIGLSIKSVKILRRHPEIIIMQTGKTRRSIYFKIRPMSMSMDKMYSLINYKIKKVIDIDGL